MLFLNTKNKFTNIKPCLSLFLLVAFNFCLLNAQVDCTEHTGNIFFDQCDNQTYFFIETSTGDILDPYYADSVDFTHYEGQNVAFNYVSADFTTPCTGATAVIITCIEEAIVVPTDPCEDLPFGTTTYDCPLVLTMCPEQTLSISVFMAGAAAPVPDGVDYGTYYISPGFDECYVANCSYGNVSPETTTLYTIQWDNPTYNSFGTGYIQVVVEDCGLSTDAGISYLSSPSNNNPLNEGWSDMVVNLRNYDNASLFNTEVHWSVNGVLQPIYFYDETLQPDSILYQSSTLITLGEYFFDAATTYELKFWTNAPNGLLDTDNSNDTLTVLFDAFVNTPDVRASSFASPTNPIESGTDSIKLNVVNIGNTIVQSLTVDWTFNGTAQPTIQFEQLNLAVGESTELFLDTHNFDSNADYTITAIVSNPNGQTDPSPINNSIGFEYVPDYYPYYVADEVYYLCLGDTVRVGFPTGTSCSGNSPPLFYSISNWSPDTNISDAPYSGTAVADVYPTNSTFYTFNLSFNNPCSTNPGPNPGPQGPTLTETKHCYFVVDDCNSFSGSDAAPINYTLTNAWEYGPNKILVDLANLGDENIYTLDLAWSINGEIQSEKFLDLYSSTTYGSASPVSVFAPKQIALESFNVEVATDYDIKIWTANPNGFTDLDTSNDTLHLFFPAIEQENAMNGNYTIGINGDYTSLNEAANALSDRGINGAVTFNIESGIYDEFVSIKNIPGSSCDRPITFQSATGNPNDVVLYKISDSPYYHYPLKIEGVAGIHLRNLQFQSKDKAIFADGADCILIDNVHFILEGESDHQEEALYLHYCDHLQFTNNFINNQSTGISLLGSIDILIDNNNFVGQEYNAVVGKSSQLRITNNTIQSRYGMYFSSCQAEVSYNFINSEIGLRAKNDIENDGSWGYFLNYIVNQLNIDKARLNIHDNTISGERILIKLEDIWGSVYNNNLAAYDSIESNTHCFDYRFYTTNQEMSIRNNNIYSPNTLPLYLGIDANSGLSNGFDIDYNNYYTNGPTVATYNGVAYASVEDWKNALNIDAKSVSLDPQYTDSTDLHINNAALFEIGDPSQEGTLDIDGELRDATPSIGADHNNGQILNPPSNPIFDPNNPIVLDPNGGNEEPPVINPNPDFGWGLGGSIDPNDDDDDGDSKHDELGLGGRPAPDANNPDETDEAETPKGIDGVTFKWEEEIKLDLQVYPNPSNGLVYLTLPHTTATQSINVYDLQGRLLLTNLIDVEDANRQLILDLTAYGNGSYIVECVSDHSKTTQRLVIQQ